MKGTFETDRSNKWKPSNYWPNDMKMLAMLAGELTISAKYFSPKGCEGYI